jgi:uncharacterized protein (TIGR03083 family)
MDDGLLAQIEAEHADLSRLLAALSEEEAARPGRLGDWSAREIVAHLIGWEAKCIEVLTALAEERTPERAPETDPFNAASVQDREGATWAELRAEFDATNRTLLDLARALPEAAWQRRRTSLWLRATTIEHYQEHRPHFAPA